MFISKNKLVSRDESGAALLAFMLVMITAASFLLVSKLNANIQIVASEEDTRATLNLAKQALIGYAISYPDTINSADGPGYLPCPDTDNDGDAEGNCSSAGNTTTGRLPYETLELFEPNDASGQRFWYAISENFRYGANKTIPLNNESPLSAQLSVNGTSDIVAVIIAPGAPVGLQSRDPNDNVMVNEIQNYLEDDNNNLDLFVTAANGDFNDAVIAITRDELMQAVGKRVSGEVNTMLTGYRSIHGAYPWLTPFADPKSSSSGVNARLKVNGTHNGVNNSASLSDTTANFINSGIMAGDIVRNINDGSFGVVNVVAATTLTITGQSQGAENDFDVGDGYEVYRNTYTNNAFATFLIGTATGGSNSLTLEDTGKDFVDLSIAAGDIIDNITDGSSGMVDSITATQLTVKSLSGGSFDNGDTYLIRNNAGRATGGSSNLTLEDINKDFNIMGVLPGDLVINNTDGSFGRVTAVSSSTTLIVDRLDFGAANIFSNNDYYTISRFNTDSNTREGNLSFHEGGELFSTAFGVDFNIVANGGDVSFDTINFPGTQAVYSNALQTYITNYVNASSETFDLTEGACAWIVPEIADCYGMFEDFVNISGRDTASINSAIQITDSTADFITDGVKRGDLAQNYDDESFLISGTAEAGSTGTTLVDSSADFSVFEPYSFVIQNDTLEVELGQPKIQAVISEIIDANTLVAVNYTGEGDTPTPTTIVFRTGDTYSIYVPRRDIAVTNTSSATTVSIQGLSAANPDFDAGEYYRIIPAARSISDSVDSTSPVTCTAGAVCTIADASGDFLNQGISRGDIIENTSDTPNQSLGRITSVTATTVTTVLFGGTLNTFTPADNYTIYHDFVHSRRHEIHARFRGDQETKTSFDEKRLRDVCLGYIADCSATSAAVAFSGNGGVSLITMHDYEIDGTTEVGRATFTPSASSSGSLRVADIDYYLAESSGDIPEWFLKNNWHQLVYIAYSQGDVPGAAAACGGVGPVCLTLTGSGNPNNNKRAIVVIAGEESETTLNASCNATATVTQDRSTGKMNAYYEMENCDQDDNFQRADLSTTFNDQTRVIQ